MNRESNVYTIVYASVMVILVALVLAFTSQGLKERQGENESVDKMRQILRSINIVVSNEEAQEVFAKAIGTSYLVDAAGKKVEGDAFSIVLAKELAKPEATRKYPVFEASIDGQTKYIMALRGAGLWGPIWGYISVNEDKNTIYGADFGHASETPGLGAEIENASFGQEFIGKKFLDPSSQFVSIAVVKPGKKAVGKDYVDGISGGTITSQGVEDMLSSSIGAYANFLKN
ncbi:Na(+)-translocating NADH-quinone reductase subunit C [Bacteroidales bacterium]|nr:Na(+)-translocating NADH-quinone reductase subunit C [Bacteroidales bacterium]